MSVRRASGRGVLVAKTQLVEQLGAEGQLQTDQLTVGEKKVQRMGTQTVHWNHVHAVDPDGAA